MGYDDITGELHGEYCRFLEIDGARKQATMPRSFVKTWIGSIAYPIWITLKREGDDEFPVGVNREDKFWQLGPNMRILIASYVISNSEKMVGLIRKTYESNPAMQMLFPEVIPYNFNKTKWSNSAACINRTEDATEMTFEAGGIGGSTTSKHYDLILEDDLIYANKDDFTGRELQPNQDDIDKAIGWHKIATSLLVPGKHTRIHNTGTRWANKDLVEYIWTTQKHYLTFIRGAVDLKELEEKGGDWRRCHPTWESCYDISQLEMIRVEQGPYMFATQYLLQPSSPEERIFKTHWLQWYDKREEVPSNARIFTTVDLALWSHTTRKRTDCNAVILTCAWDEKNHFWVLHYDVARYNPSEVLEIMARHWQMFSPEQIGVESVYYQEALAHFAYRYMDEGKLPRMRIAQLTPKGNVAKDVRIRGLEAYASSLAVHCKREHTEFIEEYSDYVPGNKTCKKDILDACAYQIQIARPGTPFVVKKQRTEATYVFKMDAMELINKLKSGSEKKDRFGRPEIALDPYTEEMGDSMVDLIDAYADEG